MASVLTCSSQSGSSSHTLELRLVVRLVVRLVEAEAVGGDGGRDPPEPSLLGAGRPEPSEGLSASRDPVA